MKKKILLIILLVLLYPKLTIAVGLGKPTNIGIRYNVADPNGRCKTSTNEKCAAIGTVTYEFGESIFYLGSQTKSKDTRGINQALISVVNAIKGTTYSPLDIETYLEKLKPSYSGFIASTNLQAALNHYGITAKVYYGTLSRTDAAKKMKEALNAGKPVMLLASHALCSDLGKSHEAELLLGLDKDGYVKMIDASNSAINPRYKKRTPEELSKCISPSLTSAAYFEMIVFEYNKTANITAPETQTTTETTPSSTTTTNDNDEEYKCGTTDEKIYCFPPILSNNNFTCANIFYFKNDSGLAEETELKKILDNIFLAIEILAPVLAIALSIIDYIKVLPQNGSLKKTNIKTAKRIALAIAIAFLPYLLDFGFKLYGLFDLSRCGIGDGISNNSKVELADETLTNSNDENNWTTENGICIQEIRKSSNTSCVNIFDARNPSTLQYPIAEAALMMSLPNPRVATGSYGSPLYIYIYEHAVARSDEWKYRTGVLKEASNGSTRYKSCSNAVAAVVRWAGADDDVPDNQISQLIYYRNNPDKWMQVKWNGDINKLEPGDIFVDYKHTFIYIGKELLHKYFPDAPANYNISEANYSYDYINSAKSLHIDNRYDLLSGRWTNYVFRNIKRETNSKYSNLKYNS